MRIAYLDCFAGAAGDMFTAAMISAGADAESLARQIYSLGLPHLQLKVEKVMRAGIACTYFKPLAPHEHVHRHLPDIVKIISASDISEAAKKNAVAIFELLAKAEAKVHDTTPEKIHFHEVGAVDSIVDIVSACVCMDMLQTEKLHCSPVVTGYGMTKCAHGLMPVPAPATAEILRSASIPTTPGPIEAEMLTPTGAAIIAHFAQSFGPPPAMAVESVGYGAGTADHKIIPNAVRLLIGSAEAQADTETDTVALLETNIDDASGEDIGHLHDLLLAGGALDVFTTPIYMKKNRPAAKLSVICKPQNREQMKSVMFESGITLGIRHRQLERSILKRHIVKVETEFGPIRVKTAAYKGKTVIAKPEYDDCKAAAEKFGTSLARIRAAVEALMDHKKPAAGN